MRPRHTVHPVHKIQWFEYHSAAEHYFMPLLLALFRAVALSLHRFEGRILF
jgi:hypothetical protein